MLFPVVYCAILSLHDAYLYNFLATPPFSGLANYRRLAGDSYFGRAIARTGVYVASAITLECLLGTTIALALDRVRRGKPLIFTLAVLPIMVTPVAVGLMWRYLLSDVGGIIPYAIGRILPGIPSILGNQALAFWAVIAIEVWWQTPFFVLVISAGLQSIPREPLDAAQIDGATRTQILRYVTLPLLRPVLTIALVLRGMDALKAFDFIFSMTEGGPGDATQVVGVYLYKAGFSSGLLSYASTLSIAVLAIVLVFALFGIRVVFREMKG